MTSSGSTNIWVTWTSTTDTATSTASTNSTSTWSTWNEDATSTCCATSGTSNEYTWKIWVTANGDSPSYVYTIPNQEQKEESAKERKARIRREAAEKKRRAKEAAKFEAARKKREAKRKKAEVRASDLLMDLIGEEEVKRYKETGRLFVKGKKYDYIVQKQGLIQRIEKDKIQDLCIHLENRYKFPMTDNVVAMKLLIEADEEGLLKKANEHGSRPLPDKLPKAACLRVA